MNAESAFDKIQQRFIINEHPISKLGLEGDFLKLIKNIYKKLTANIIHNGEKLDAFPLMSKTRKRYLLSSILLNIILEVLACAIK